MSLLLPRKLSRYDIPNIEDALFATMLYENILESVRKNLDLEFLAFTSPSLLGITQETCVEFWMTPENSRENFPLFGDACFQNAEKTKNLKSYHYVFSPGKQFETMYRKGMAPYYTVFDFNETSKGITIQPPQGLNHRPLKYNSSNGWSATTARSR